MNSGNIAGLQKCVGVLWNISSLPVVQEQMKMRGDAKSVVVANRHHEELSELVNIENIYFADRPFAAGILEAIEYYDFFHNDS